MLYQSVVIIHSYSVGVKNNLLISKYFMIAHSKQSSITLEFCGMLFEYFDNILFFKLSLFFSIQFISRSHQLKHHKTHNNKFYYVSVCVRLSPL